MQISFCIEKKFKSTSYKDADLFCFKKNNCSHANLLAFKKKIKKLHINNHALNKTMINSSRYK